MVLKERLWLSEIVLEQPFNYYLWLLTLTLSFSSSIQFYRLYVSTKGTPLGKVAFFISINSFLWSLALGFLAVASITMIGVDSWIFLTIVATAGIASSVGAYYRAQIVGLLHPRGEKESHFPFCYAMSGLTIVLVIVGDLFDVLNIQLFNTTVYVISILGSFGLLAVALSIVALTLPKSPRPRYTILGAGIALAIAIIVLFGHVFGVPTLYSPFGGKATSDLTAVGLGVASAWTLLSLKRGVKVWAARFIPATGVLLIAVLALVGYFTNMPVLFNGGTMVKMSVLTAACFFFIGLAQLWYSWKK